MNTNKIASKKFCFIQTVRRHVSQNFIPVTKFGGESHSLTYSGLV